MAINIASLLSGIGGSGLEENPYYASAIKLRNAPPIDYSQSTSTQALLGPILQGLISGGLQGYGEGQNIRESRPSYTRVMEALGQPDYGKIAESEDWTPKKAERDVVLGLLGYQTKAELEKEAVKEALRGKREQTKLDATFANAKALEGIKHGNRLTEIAKKDEFTKLNKKEKSPWEVIPASEQGKILGSVGTVKEIDRVTGLLDKMAKEGAGTFTYQLGKQYSKTQSAELDAQIKALATAVAKASSPGNLSEWEQKTQQQILSGDYSSDPATISRFIKNAKKRIIIEGIGKLKAAEAVSKEGTQGLKDMFLKDLAGSMSKEDFMALADE